MARNRPSSRRRHVWRKAREMEEKGQAEAASDPAQASTTEAATSASAHDAKDTADETKARPCKHRHLPDRHYYYREEKFDLRFFTLDRRINERLDDNIAKGRAAIDAEYHHHTEELPREHKKLLTKVEREAYKIQRGYRMDIRNTEREVASLKRKVAEMQEENEDLRDEIRRERRRTRRMMFQRYDDSSHGQEAECAE